MEAEDNNFGIDNIYEQYIAHLKSKQGLFYEKTEKHRLYPGHQGGTYDPNNVILIPFREHTLAHFYRFLAYGDTGDLIAYTLMSGQTEEGRRQLSAFAGRAGRKVRSQQMAAAKQLFFDPEWQKRMGFKNGGKRNVESGSLARTNQWLTENDPEERSRAGKLGAKTRIEKQRLERTAFFAENLWTPSIT